jgi:hypothetical protein
MSKASKKKRLTPSAAPGIDAQRVGRQTAAQRAPNGDLSVAYLAKVGSVAWAPNLGRPSDFTGAIVPQPSDGLPVDANLDRANRAAQTAYQTGLSTPPIANAPQAAAEKLSKAIAEIDRALVKIRAGKAADQYSRVDRLEKAKAACVTARDSILSKSDTGSAGQDPGFRARQTNESAAPGYSTAVAGIAKLQARQNRSRT